MEQNEHNIAAGLPLVGGGAGVRGAIVGGSVPVVVRKRRGSLVETLVLVVMTLIAATFVGLFVWAYLQWDETKSNVQGQIDVAVAEAVDEQKVVDEENFAGREKLPSLEFAGPDDYGRLSFLYPRTWSVYVAQDASRGGDYEAYLNPKEVMPVSATTINALRVVIYNRSFEDVAGGYDGLVKSGELTFSTVELNGAVVNRYDGSFSDGIVGSGVLIRIRDKTALLRTDAEIFRADFETLIGTVQWND